jgi:hypothetical protein
MSYLYDRAPAVEFMRRLFTARDRNQLLAPNAIYSGRGL